MSESHEQAAGGFDSLNQNVLGIKEPESNKQKSKRGGRRIGAGRKKRTPEQVAKALKLDLDPRKRLYVEGRVKGLSQTKAALQAGYAVSTSYRKVASIENSPDVQKAFRQIFNQVCTDEQLAQRIAEGLHATETKFFQKDGRVIETHDVVDWSERRQYAELAASVKGVISKDEERDYQPIQVRIIHVGGEVLVSDSQGNDR